MSLLSSQERSLKRWRGAVFLALFGAFIVFAKLMNTNPPTNTARTAPDDADLRTRLYEITPDEAAKHIVALPLSTYGRAWTATEQNHISQNEIKIVFRVPVLVFSDVLTVTLKRKEGEATQVNVESHSQVGKGDFGENRRHVRQILSAMDTAFGH